MALDHYRALGVEPSADAAHIKTAYRQLAKTYHPDRNRADPFAEDMFKRINEAYTVLSDPVKRQRYDASLRRPKVKVAPQPPPARPAKDEDALFKQIIAEIEAQLKPPAFTLDAVTRLPRLHYALLGAAFLLFFCLGLLTSLPDGGLVTYGLLHGLGSSYLVNRFTGDLAPDEPGLPAYVPLSVALSHAAAFLLSGFVLFVVLNAVIISRLLG